MVLWLVDQCVCVCVCMWVCVCVCVCVCACVCVCVCVWVRETETDRLCVCVCEREREREIDWLIDGLMNKGHWPISWEDSRVTFGSSMEKLWTYSNFTASVLPSIHFPFAPRFITHSSTELSFLRNTSDIHEQRAPYSAISLSWAVFIYSHEFERERENSNSNSKTLFYKDCNVGSV